MTSDIPGFPSLAGGGGGGGGGVEGKGGEVGGEEEEGGQQTEQAKQIFSCSHALCSNNFTFVSSNQEAVS